MTPSPYQITLATVSVEGLDTEHSARAEKDIRDLFDTHARIADDLVGEVRVSVFVTDQMDTQIDRIAAEHGTFIGPYNSKKSFGETSGIVQTRPGGPPFEVAVVLRCEPWSRDDGLAVLERFYILAHEFGHVLQRGRGEADSRRTEPRTHANELRSVAAILANEIDADCTALTICTNCLRQDDGTPPRLSDLIGHRYIESAHNLAEALCAFASVDVPVYRITHAGLENLFPKVGSLISELLVVLAHAASMFAVDQRMDYLLDELQKSPGFRTYIMPDAHDLFTGMMADDRAAGFAQVIAAFERILGRLGLEIEDLPDGNVYVHVSEPEQCACPEQE